MNLKDVILPEHCAVVKSRTKTEALLEILELVKGWKEVSDIESLKKEIFFREQLMSTGIGQGIGIPHVRFKGIQNPAVLVGVCPEGIEDYGSMDGNPVNLIFMFIVGENQHKEYLRLLSLVSSRIKDEKVREKLIDVGKSSEIVSILTDGDKA